MKGIFSIGFPLNSLNRLYSSLTAISIKKTFVSISFKDKTGNENLLKLENFSVFLLFNLALII